MSAHCQTAHWGRQNHVWLTITAFIDLSLGMTAYEKWTQKPTLAKKKSFMKCSDKIWQSSGKTSADWMCDGSGLSLGVIWWRSSAGMCWRCVTLRKVNSLQFWCPQVTRRWWLRFSMWAAKICSISLERFVESLGIYRSITRFPNAADALWSFCALERSFSLFSVICSR